MSKFIRKWPITSLLLFSTTATATSGYIIYNNSNRPTTYQNLPTKKIHTCQKYFYQKPSFSTLLPINSLFPVAHLEQDPIKNNKLGKKESSTNGKDAINNSNNNQLTDILEAAKANLLNIQDQLTRSILSTFPLIDDFQDLSPAELRERMATLWETLNLTDIINSIKDINDIDSNPELGMDATVRFGSDLSEDERKFIENRKEKQRLAFAKFIGVDPMKVELEDMPIVAIASSGGGMRALLGLTGYLNGLKKTGVLDCVMYTAGVSGSTWAMSLYYSSLVKCDPEAMINYLKLHVNTHFANVSRVLTLAAASPQNTKLLLQGIGQRYLQHSTVNLVDLFGTLIASTLFTISKDILDDDDDDSNNNSKISANDNEKKNVRNNDINDKKDSVKGKEKKMVELLLNNNEMKLSNQKKYFEDGSQPMPIYCVVREDITIQEQKNMQENNDYSEEATNDDDQEKHSDDESEPHMYQWFEFTSFEMGSEDINAWIPIWAFGRKFEKGKNVERLPEQRIDSLLGMFGSAFAASVKHFYREIRHFLPTSIIELTDETIGRFDKTLSTLHPISPAIYPNPFYHVQNKKLTAKSSSIVDSENILLMDAGMDNNIPFYPLLRKDREVDVILAIDLSADIQTAPHFERAEGYVKRRKISGWPLNMGWNKRTVSDTIEGMDKKTMKDIEREDKQKCEDNIIPMEEGDNENDDNKIIQKQKYSLGPCTVFPSSAVTKFDDGDNNNRLITLIYFPFICNEKFDPDFDPQIADFCSTANFVYDSKQVDRLTKLAEINVSQNVDQIRSVLYGAWKRKQQQRNDTEKMEKMTNLFLYP